jgi:hypothetical protein
MVFAYGQLRSAALCRTVRGNDEATGVFWVAILFYFSRLWKLGA